ncbi:hypothetical protein QJS66_18950 [Kocuria rhizophila]|nr:hypothetical protein QJS66_18950 [Kocuria rhizophila]
MKSCGRRRGQHGTVAAALRNYGSSTRWPWWVTSRCGPPPPAASAPSTGRSWGPGRRGYTPRGPGWCASTWYRRAGGGQRDRTRPAPPRRARTPWATPRRRQARATEDDGLRRAPRGAWLHRFRRGGGR